MSRGEIVNIEARLKESQSKIQELNNNLNALEQQKQELLQEMLRLDGEIQPTPQSLAGNAEKRDRQEDGVFLSKRAR